MSEKTLLVIGPEDVRSPGGLIDAVMSAWVSPDRPTLTALTIDQLMHDHSPLTRAGVAWILTDDCSCPSLNQVIELLQDHHVPVMLSRPSETGIPGSMWMDAVVLGPPKASPQILIAVLGALWSQVISLDSLQTELRLAHVHQSGLCGQIENLDEELRLAARIQREFLPRALPTVGPVEFRALYRPAGYVSGDFYDVERVDEDHISFFIADAVGHGVPAALLTMYIKSSLRTKETNDLSPLGYHILPPEETLSDLNCKMCQQHTGKVRLATACYGLINVKTFEMTLARAGHPFPLLLRPDGSCSPLDANGPALGVFADATFESTTIQLSPADRLLLYTDGFELAFDESKNLAYTDRLKETANGTLDEAIERLRSKLDRQSGSLHQNDDITALLMGISNHNEPDEVAREPGQRRRLQNTPAIR